MQRTETTVVTRGQISKRAIDLRATRHRLEYAAKIAQGIVRKFPQVEQAVLAPLLVREIGHAILRALAVGHRAHRRKERDQKVNSKGLTT